jgi:hypothetical protein
VSIQANGTVEGQAAITFASDQFGVWRYALTVCLGIQMVILLFERRWRTLKRVSRTMMPLGVVLFVVVVIVLIILKPSGATPDNPTPLKFDTSMVGDTPPDYPPGPG